MSENEGRILIVEDEVPLLNLLKINLIQQGVDPSLIDEAIHEQEALDQINKNRYAIILLDSRLDKRDTPSDTPGGNMVAEAIRESPLNKGSYIINTSNKFKNPLQDEWLHVKNYDITWEEAAKKIVDIRNQLLAKGRTDNH